MKGRPTPPVAPRIRIRDMCGGGLYVRSVVGLAWCIIYLICLLEGDVFLYGRRWWWHIQRKEAQGRGLYHQPLSTTSSSSSSHPPSLMPAYPLLTWVRTY